MIYLYFFLKFKSQLKRTRPEIIRQLDEAIIRSINDAGGKITGDRFVISAVFNEETIGLWLNMYIIMENLIKNIENSNDFFGYSLVISGKKPNFPDLLCRFLANFDGVFINGKVVRSFVPYAVFQKPAEWMSGLRKFKYSSGGFYKIKELKTFNINVRDDFEFQNEIFKVLEEKKGRNILFICENYSKIQYCLHKYSEENDGDFPPLTICFGSIGIGALVDAWSFSIRSLSGMEIVENGAREKNKDLEEINMLWETLFCERVKEEISEYSIRRVKRFLFLLLDFYCKAALKKNSTPILIFEKINLAEEKIKDIIFDALDIFFQENGKKISIYGIDESKVTHAKTRAWEYVFNSIVDINDKNANKINIPKLSSELWEIVYAISLFERYFSPELFLILFEEDEINPSMIRKAFSILYDLNIINNIHAPRITNKIFVNYAYKVLTMDEKKKVNKLVSGRLLAWAKNNNLNPCFNLIKFAIGLGGVDEIDDVLLLKSISLDVMNETTFEIEICLKKNFFNKIIPEKTEAVKNIYYTSQALHSKKFEEIEKVFSRVPVDEYIKCCASYPEFNIQTLVNLSSYYIGINDIKEAASKSKEAILIAQKSGSFCLPQGYRIFALVCLTKQQTMEANEYISFALSNSEKSGNYQEFAISSYYAAVIKYLYGDIFNANLMVKKAVSRSLGAGCYEWADRSRFLEGRIEFELGYYNKALLIFEETRNSPFGKRNEEKNNILEAWIYRCKIYIKNQGVSKPESTCFDTELFEIEAAYISGNYKKTFELSNSIYEKYSKDKFLFTEQADWTSGFAQCENLYFTDGEIQNRFILLFRFLALSHRFPKGIEEAKLGIQKLLRDEKLCEIDPWDAFYFYAKYLILKQAGAEVVDLSTAVSMAFKRLQRRAGRIEDFETCRQYLNSPRWNSELSKTAREFNLI